jgi:TolB protein
LKKWIVTGLLLALSVTFRAQAALTIEITQGVEGALPIAVVPFEWTGTTPPPQSIATIIASDLARSGRFAPMATKDMLARPHAADQVKFQNWRIINMEYLVVGKLGQPVNGLYPVQFQLMDVFKAEQLAGFSFKVPAKQLRNVAHHISDLIYEKLTGQKGAFNTRIAYVTAEKQDGKQRYLLNISDADGHNEQTILNSPEPLMSPSWSSDGKQLVYVTFEGRRARIFSQDVASGTRRELSSFQGINGAPAWSPDNRRMALTLSKDGNPEIYVMDLATGGLTRITQNSAIDTEAVWSPDGRLLVFTSDRGGKPQLYSVAVGPAGPLSRPKRITFDGEYNARASFSPDGKLLTFVHGSNGIYRIAVMEFYTSNMQVLTESRLDESPSFAPNGSMVIYATQLGDRGVLAAVSVDGRVHQKLAFKQGDVREPAWSPYND